jgi:asparagine synthase (glutamine-hydrolysing)
MPISPWLRKEARPFLRDVLSSETLRRRGMFNPSFVEKLLDEHESGFAEHGSLLWGLLSVELWQRLFLDSPQHSERNAATFAVHA